MDELHTYQYTKPALTVNCLSVFLSVDCTITTLGKGWALRWTGMHPSVRKGSHLQERWGKEQQYEGMQVVFTTD